MSLYQEALILFNAKNYQGALDKTILIKKLDPHHPLVNILQGACNRFATDVEKFLKLYPGNLSALSLKNEIQKQITPPVKHIVPKSKEELQQLILQLHWKYKPLLRQTRRNNRPEFLRLIAELNPKIVNLENAYRNSPTGKLQIAQETAQIRELDRKREEGLVLAQQQHSQVSSGLNQFMQKCKMEQRQNIRPFNPPPLITPIKQQSVTQQIYKPFKTNLEVSKSKSSGMGLFSSSTAQKKLSSISNPVKTSIPSPMNPGRLTDPIVDKKGGITGNNPHAPKYSNVSSYNQYHPKFKFSSQNHSGDKQRKTGTGLGPSIQKILAKTGINKALGRVVGGVVGEIIFSNPAN